MNDMMTHEEYKQWIADLSVRYKRSQIKAASLVNEEMLRFYWSIGRDIDRLSMNNIWGASFFDNLSNDLIRAIPNVKGFSARNLRYMHKFFQLFPDTENFLPQVAAKSDEKAIDNKLPQVVADLKGSETKSADRNIVFSIPWGHIRLLIDSCGTDSEKAIFYIQKTLENNWSRAVLLNWLDTDLYERQGKAITNFAARLPEPQSDLAQEMTKDPYNFDFLSIREKYDEKELKDALMDNIQSFLLELGTGFAFVGREYRLVVGSTEQFIDLLFYNINLHCYVVIEVKVDTFEPRDMGQLSTYVAAVDGIMKSSLDQPTIGLLICKTKDNILAQYAANVINAPVGISEYKLTNVLKEEYAGTLPSVEEIEKQLK